MPHPPFPPENTTTDHTGNPGGARNRRRLLWTCLVASAIGNATTSAIHLNPLISIGFGLMTLGCGIGLVASYRRRR